MKMRQRGFHQEESRSHEQLRGSEAERSKTRTPWSDTSLLPDAYLLVYILLLILLAGISFRVHWMVPDPVTHGGPNDFSAANARKHLEDITNLGIRHVGSPANEIHAKNLILRKVDEIRSTASDKVEIEVSVQHPSGSFHLDFLGGLTHLYHNITNIVVRFQQKNTAHEHAFLVNAHYDSALGTTAASDDAVSCATMLEVLRCLSVDPDPLLAEHAVIFLFNGAEETILQASHGFITQHPWAKQIRAFLNLEAAGAGGKEIVFQTGPENPWLVRTYANSVPHPYFSVVAQEVFQSGAIPSDTDFRIFRDYGHIPGIDTAYYVNGYVYHTEHDVASGIPDGCIQRAGDNVLALVSTVARSPYLAHPGDDRHGKVVFFDILGLVSVVYPERIAVIINGITTVASLLSIYFGVSRNRMKQDKPSFGLVLESVGVLLFSWAVAVGSALATALHLQLLGHSMTWFANPFLVLPLYAVPAFLAMAVIHEYWRRKHPALSQQALEQSSFLAAQLLWTICLVVFTLLRVCSAFVFTLWVIFPVISKGFIWDVCLKRTLDRKGGLHHIVFVIVSVLAIGLPFMLCLLLAFGLTDMFVPITGRSGAAAPPDLVIGGMIASLICLLTTYMLSVVVYSSSARMKKLIGGALLLSYLITLILALSGCIFPYSGGEQPKPKRFFLLHTDRVFYNADGSVRNNDSQVFVYTFDFLGLKPIADHVPIFREAKVAECSGVYCGEPYYIPVKHLIGTSWYLPAPKLQDVQPPVVNLLSIEDSNDGKKNFTFQAKFPLRASMFIAPRDGYSMTAWSLETFIPARNPYGDHEWCYFVLYARGHGEVEAGFTFWIEIQGFSAARESLDIAVATHNLEPPLSETELLTQLLHSLPDWVTTVAWTSTFVSWVF